MRHIRARRLTVLLLLLLLAAACPGLAEAYQLPPPCGGQETRTTVSGFVEVTGPTATDPGHAGEFARQTNAPCPPGPPPATPPAPNAPPPPAQH